MIKFVQIKQRFDVARMQQELEQLQSGPWQLHYQKHQYEGSWTSLALRSINGSLINNISIHAAALQPGQCYQDTPLLDQCDYFREIIAYFNCEKLGTRLLQLNPGAMIKEHSDNALSFEEGEARFHIPIVTNREVSFYLQEEKIPMGEGECWYLNLVLPHRVNNQGTNSRIHLVIDCIVNDWVTGLLNGEVEQKIEIPAPSLHPPYHPGDKEKIIRQLRSMGTSVSDALANQLANEPE